MEGTRDRVYGSSACIEEGDEGGARGEEQLEEEGGGTGEQVGWMEGREEFS